MWSSRLLIIELTTMLLAARLVLGLAARYTPTPHGVLVSVGANQVELAVQGQTAFRVSVSKYGAPVQIESAFLETPTSYAPFTITSQGDLVGIKAAFGSVAIDSKATFTLADPNGTVLTTSTLFAPSSFSNKNAPKDTCAQVQNSTDVTNPQRSPKYPDGLSGQTLQSCCTICNNDPDCNIFVWADNTHPDPSGKNCWMLTAVDSFIPKAGRSSGGSIPPPPGSVVLQLGVHDGNTKFYGAGGGYSTVTSITATSSNPHVSNTEFTVPHYWSNDGYAALGVTASQYDPKALNAYQATWSASQAVTWTFSGNQSDLYLMPAASMLDGQRVYWDLTGRPRVLPRYGHGFLASRWGWTDRAYIESMLTQFRSGSFPIDAWISDFEVL